MSRLQLGSAVDTAEVSDDFVLPAPSLARRIYNSRIHYLFILPSIAMILLFAYYPVTSALYHSFFQWDGFSPPRFIGFSNFVEIFQSPLMHAAMFNVARLALFAVVVSIVVPLGVARLILSVSNLRAQYALRVLFVIPLIMTNVVIYLIWQFIYDPNFGLGNRLLEALHIWHPQGWLGDPKEALYALMGIGFPWVDGFALLIFTAGLQNIPRDLREAASIDGASAWRTFRRVELPLVMGQVRLIATLNMIWAIQDFTTVLILTQGGPGTATYVPGMALYEEGFQNGQMGYACAIGTVMFLVMLALTYLFLNFRARHYEPARRGAVAP
jgi:ABC-type sugar transport system permease subunit